MPKWSARGRRLGGAESWLMLAILTVAPTWAQQGNSQQGARAPRTTQGRTGNSEAAARGQGPDTLVQLNFALDNAVGDIGGWHQ